MGRRKDCGVPYGPDNAVRCGGWEAPQRFDTLTCQKVMTDAMLSRRSALARMAGFIGLALVPMDSPTSEPFPHPDPRAGITSENVLPEEKLPDKKRVREGFAAAREHPEIFDGIYCPC